MNETIASFEHNLEENWLPDVILIKEGEIQSCLLVFGCARVAEQVHHGSLLEILQVLLSHPESSIENGALFQLVLIFAVGVGEVNDEAEGSCVCSIKLDFCLVFGPYCFVDFFVDEAFHGVQVDDVLDDWVAQIRKNCFSQWLVNVAQPS